MMGKHLLDQKRWDFIDLALKEGLSITAIADYLHYNATVRETEGTIVEDYYEWVQDLYFIFKKGKIHVTIERFPMPFQKLILRFSRGRQGLDSRSVNDLWVLYSKLWPPEREPNFLRLLRDQSMTRFNRDLWPLYQSIKETEANPNLTQDDLALRVLKDTRAKSRPSYLFPGDSIRSSIKEGASIRFINLKLDSPLKSSQLMFNYKGSLLSGKGTFNVSLIDEALIERLSLEYGHLGTVFFHIKGNILSIKLLQAWPRVSSRTEAWREQLGSVERILEQSFRAFAKEMGFDNILAPTGDQLFYTTQIPLHRNSVERLNNMYRNSGYRLVSYHRRWWWELDLSLTPGRSIIRKKLRSILSFKRFRIRGGN